MLKDPEGDQAFALSHSFTCSPNFLLPTVLSACGPPTDGNAEMDWPQLRWTRPVGEPDFLVGWGARRASTWKEARPHTARPQELLEWTPPISTSQQTHSF